jgi:hypothetical protein
VRQRHQGHHRKDLASLAQRKHKAAARGFNSQPGPLRRCRLFLLQLDPSGVPEDK